MYSIPDNVCLLLSIFMISYLGSSTYAILPCPWAYSAIGGLVVVPLVGPRGIVALRISGLTPFDLGEVLLA